MIQKIKYIKHFLIALFSVIYYRYPTKKLKVIGVTGTDGKTTTANLIFHLLIEGGLKAAMITTLGAMIGEEKIDTGLHVTTPDSRKVQRLLRTMVDRGVEFVVLEATSHGLDQHRLLGCNFRVAVLTNVTREHLDYHLTFQNYLKAKAKLFQGKGVRHAVLNRDDPSFRYFVSVIKEELTSIISYGMKKNANLTPQKFPFKTKLLGEHNRYNCLAAIAVARIFEIPEEKIRKALLKFQPLKGRLEEIKEGQKFKVFIDFAHTPAAFKSVIPTVRNLTKGEIIHVFGCTGDRDKSKRPLMGQIAARLSDKIILTHEDTYKENPQKIILEIEPGVKRGGKILNQTYWRIPDRGEAIRKAIGFAKKGDSVLITGVGHQATLNLGGKEVPWSDPKEVRLAIEEKLSD